MKSFELGAIPMATRKTKENIRKAMRDCCAKWKIMYSKVRAVITDGGANIKEAA